MLGNAEHLQQQCRANHQSQATTLYSYPVYSTLLSETLSDTNLRPAVYNLSGFIFYNNVPFLKTFHSDSSNPSDSTVGLLKE